MLQVRLGSVHAATAVQHLLSELLLLLFPEQGIHDLLLNTPANERGVYSVQCRKGLRSSQLWVFGQTCGRKGENVTLDESTNSSTQQRIKKGSLRQSPNHRELFFQLLLPGSD